MGRVHSAVVLKFMVAPVVATLGGAIVIGQTWLACVSFGLLLVTLRVQRAQELKRQHGYRRKRRRRKQRSSRSG